MAEWLAVISVAGKRILIVAVGIFVPTVAVLALYTIRKGERDDARVTPAVQPYAAYGRVAKLKAVAKRIEFISMESLVHGTATPTQWAVVIGIETALICFFLIFLGFGLMELPNSSGLSLFFPAVVGLWLLRVFQAQWSDLKRARSIMRRIG